MAPYSIFVLKVPLNTKNQLMSQLLSWYQMLLVDFRSVTSHLMSNDVLGLVASNIAIKDLIQSAVCAFFVSFFKWCIILLV